MLIRAWLIRQTWWKSTLFLYFRNLYNLSLMTELADNVSIFELAMKKIINSVLDCAYVSHNDLLLFHSLKLFVFFSAIKHELDIWINEIFIQDLCKSEFSFISKNVKWNEYRISQSLYKYRIHNFFIFFYHFLKFNYGQNLMDLIVV